MAEAVCGCLWRKFDFCLAKCAKRASVEQRHVRLCAKLVSVYCNLRTVYGSELRLVYKDKADVNLYWSGCSLSGSCKSHILKDCGIFEGYKDSFTTL